MCELDEHYAETTHQKSSGCPVIPEKDMTTQTLKFLLFSVLFDFIPLIHTIKNAHLVMYLIWPKDMTAKGDKKNKSSHVICSQYCIGVGVFFFLTIFTVVYLQEIPQQHPLVKQTCLVWRSVSLFRI